MKRFWGLFIVWMVLLAAPVWAQGQALVQIIHNAADPAADSVDLYLDGSLLASNFAFRKASGFLPVNAGTPINIGVAPGGSGSVNDTIANFTVTLDSGETYVVMANGVLTPGNFVANPNARSIGFSLYPQPGIRQVGDSATAVDFVVYHGATDAPGVDVWARGVAKIVDSAKYTDYTNYISVPPASYTLDVTPEGDSTTIVASFTADLSGLGGGSAVVFASGFLDTTIANQNGEAFGLFAALANGTVVEFAPVVPTANVQVIHNAADPAASSVDIYLNGGILLPNFAFRDASGFVAAPAGTPIDIGIAPAGSGSANDTIANFSVTLTPGETYVVMASGVLTPGNFVANPDGRSIGFSLYPQSGIRQVGDSATAVDFVVYHGATDAPGVDVWARSVAKLVDSAKYTDYTGYISVPPASYILDVTPEGDPNTVVASFDADLSGLGGGSAVVFASGFLDASIANQNGEAFGLFAALADGTVVPFPVRQEARVQVIHNAADPAADTVDIYLNGTALLTNFGFRDASPFVWAPAGTPIDIGVAPAGSGSANDTIANFNLTLTPGETYVVMANGVLTPGNFVANPDGRSIGFSLYPQSGIRQAGDSATAVDFVVYHGATDAPGVDVWARDVAKLVDSAKYTDYTGYISVPPASYTLDVTPEGDPNTIVGSFTADLSGLGGGSAVVFASGFLDTTIANQNGEAFGLFAALADGTVVPFPQITTANVQVIHNAADPAADTVDIYLNGGILLPNFKFRDASGFVAAPAPGPIDIGIAPAGSGSANDTIANFNVSLIPGETYVVMANGVLTPGNFVANPDGRSIGFSLYPQPGIRQVGDSATAVDFVVYHGATDAPGVDVWARGVAKLVDSAKYTDYTNYISVPPASYILDVTPEGDSTTIVGSFTADLSGLGGGSAVVFASGFLDTTIANQNGEAFGLFAALADGTVVPFPPVVPTANVQVIHNAADPAADTVDIYLNGSPLLTNFAFRDASGFVPAPAGTPIDIGIAPAGSGSANDTIANFSVTLTEGETYVVMANGVLTPGNFVANPDGRSIGFSLYPQSGIRQVGDSATAVDFVVYHGATDAPGVDVWARDVAKLVDSAKYTDYTGYISVPPASYTLDVTPEGDPNTIVGSFTADLSSLGGGAAVVFASGFLDTTIANQNGEAFGLFAALADGTVVPFPQITQASIQLIHNAADPGVAAVDVYLNGGILADNFAFRQASGFLPVSATGAIDIGFAPGNSGSVNDTIANFSLTLTPGESYVGIANGVLTPGSFVANPDGRSIAFDVYAQPGIRQAGDSATAVDFVVYHGATDAPGVDVWARDVAKLVDSAKYTDFTEYISVPPASYTLDVTPEGDPNTIVGSFTADLSGLGGGAAVVFASGFLDTTIANQNGEAFGLFAALPTGLVVPFPEITTANVQVIHNAADPAADTVDIYLNGGILLPNFGFRDASGFVAAPAPGPIDIGIAPAGSGSANDTIANFNVSLIPGETYVVMANGVLTPGNFVANPDGRSIGFSLYPQSGIQQVGDSATAVDFVVYHGATDAPGVDVWARDVAKLVDSAKYTDYTGYISVPPASYTLDVTPEGDSTTIVASFTADLSGLGGGSAVVFASGFLDTTIANQNGEAFGLFAALANGTVVPFPQITTARVQVIHNAADPGASSVDIYLNGGILLPNFAFRDASGFVTAPAGTPIDIGVAPAGSGSANDTIANFNLTLTPGETYLVEAVGVLTPGTFAPNPDGINTAFTLVTKAGAREAATGGDAEFVVGHGVTDAPGVDIWVQGIGKVVDSARYQDITDYLSLAPGNYLLDIKPEGDPVTILKSYQVDLTGLGGSAFSVFASGFYDSTVNQNGPSFQLLVALADGTTLLLPEVPPTSVFEDDGAPLPRAFELAQNYPNPFNPATTISFSVANAGQVTLKIYNLLGREVETLIDQKLQAGVYEATFDAARLPSGVYFYRLEADGFTETRKMSLVK